MESDEIKSNENIEKEYQEFREFCNSCEDTQEKNSQSQDKLIIAISSALFGILLALLNGGLLAKVPQKLFGVLILSGAITLICALVSYSTANWAIDKKVSIALHKSNEKNYWDSITKCLNKIYVSATCVMIISLAITMWIIF